jgi:hypothetical protein
MGGAMAIGPGPVSYSIEEPRSAGSQLATAPANLADAHLRQRTRGDGMTREPHPFPIRSGESEQGYRMGRAPAALSQVDRPVAEPPPPRCSAGGRV